MIKIDKIVVAPINVDKLMVQWSYVPTFENFADYEFLLERSLSPESGYEPVAKFNDTVQFLDTVNYKRLWKTVYYRIKITHLPSGKTAYSENGKIGYEPNLEALEIIRRNNILLKNKRHGIGVPIAVCLRKRSGQRCPECWDLEKQRVRASNCDSCFQTGYLDGFYSPIITWANMTPDTKTNPLPQWGETEPNDTRIFIGNYPEVLPKDVIIEPSILRVWTVENVDTTARRGHTLHQLLGLAYVDRNSVLYKLLEKHTGLIDQIRTQKNKIELS
jgi:hypothetical protein